MSKEKDFVCFLLLEERMPRTTAKKCAVYEGKPCCQRQKDGRKIHSGRGGVIMGSVGIRTGPYPGVLRFFRRDIQKSKLAFPAKHE